MTSWLIPVGLLVLVLFLLGLRLVWQILWPSEYKRQRVGLERATRDLGEALGRELEPALRRLVAEVEKIAERLP